MKRLVLSVLAVAMMAFAAPVARAATVEECLGPSGGVPYTMGWWKSKHGRAAVGEADLLALRLANLVDAEGNDFDPTTYDELRDWLNEADATNMAYMLSAQFATAILNVINGAVSSSLLIYAPGTNAGGTDGIATLSAVMHEANAALAADGLTLAGDPNRAYQEALKNALDNANNDLNFIQPGCLD